MSLAMLEANASQPESYYRKIIVDYCKHLKVSGVLQVAKISIDDLIVKGNDIKIQVTDIVAYPSKEKLPLITTRNSAYWDPAQGAIIVSEKHGNVASAEIFSNLMIHEFYRAAGIYDENYNTSTLTNAYLSLISANINSMLQSENSSILSLLRNKIASAESGGYSGVGGGGDLFASSFKKLLMHTIIASSALNGLSSDSIAKIIDQIVDTKFEISKDESLMKNSNKYEYDIESGTFLLSESIFTSSETYRSVIILFSRALIDNALEHQQ